MKIAGLTAWIVTVCGGGKHQSSLALCCDASVFCECVPLFSEILENMHGQLMSTSFVVMVTLSKMFNCFDIKNTLNCVMLKRSLMFIKTTNRTVSHFKHLTIVIFYN